ncbi:MAG: hypothetical protein DRH04_00700 [Deltaproteobacteria bacterium]|nr:MAG: hypothetical protein DRH04_00700 [Deltaproteobacteria bacterium]
MKYQCPLCGCITGNPDTCETCGSSITGKAKPVKTEAKKAKPAVKKFRSPARVMPTAGPTGDRKATSAARAAPGKKPAPIPTATSGPHFTASVAPAAKPPPHPVVRFFVLILSIAAFFGSFWLAMWLAENFDQARQLSTSHLSESHQLNKISKGIKALIKHIKPGRHDRDAIIKITADHCYFRTYPEVTSGNIWGTLSKNNFSQIFDKRKVQTTLWYQVSFYGKKGWVSEHVCKVVSSKESNIHILANLSVSLKKHPRSSSKTVAQIYRGELVQLLRKTGAWEMLRDEYGNVGYVPSGTLKFEPDGE